MKKRILMIGIASVLALSGCSFGAAPAEPPEENPPKADNKNIIHHRPESSADVDGYNKVKDFSYDFDGDGEEDLLELLTTAQLSGGEPHLDDGQNWMITVTTKEGIYTLLDNYIQLGSPMLDIGELYNAEPVPIIILTQTTGAGKSITHYTFKDGEFLEELVYSTDNYSENGANIIKSIDTLRFR